MSMPRTMLTVALAAAVGVLAASCGEAETRTGQPAAAAPSTSSPTPAASRKPDNNQEDRMRIQITIGDRRFQATLIDSAASRDLIAQLPVTIDMVDHGDVEKTGPLPSSLSLDGQPDGADPEVGDVGYFAPGHDLVLYYGDQSYYPGIVILGQFEGDAAERIAALDGTVTATVESAP